MKYTIKYGPERKSIYNLIEPSFAPVVRIISGNELIKVPVMTLPIGKSDVEVTVDIVECEHCVKHAYAVVPTGPAVIYTEDEVINIANGYHEVILDTINKEVVIL